MRKNEVKKLIAQSLLYERAYSRVCRIINEVMEDKNRDAEMSKDTGEPVDGSYKLVADALGDVRERFRNESDRLWRMVDEKAEKHESGYEDLFNGIVLRAAQDYEAKLCGCLDSANTRMLKLVPPEHMLSDRIMKRIQAGQKAFARCVRDHGKEIYAETMAARKAGRDMDENGIRCPMCGGGLYTYGKVRGGTVQVKCTGCSLFDWARVEDED